MSKKRSELGFTAVEVAIVVVVFALIGIKGFVGWKNYQSSRAKQTDIATTTTPTASDSPVARPKASTVTYDLASNQSTIEIDAPADWTQNAHTGRVSRLISGVPYAVSGQVNQEDYLQLDAYSVSNTPVDQVITNSGLKLYIVEDKIDTAGENHLYVSSCLPQANQACSPKSSDGYVFIMLNEYRSGDQYVRGFPAKAASNPEAFADFIAMVKTLRFK